MRTNEEVIRAVHMRAEKIRQRQERQHMLFAGSAGVILGGLLLFIILRVDGLQHEVIATGYAGTSLLTDSTGGFVLAAVLAFMAGVVVMVIIQAWRKKNSSEGVSRKDRKDTGDKE